MNAWRRNNNTDRHYLGEQFSRGTFERLYTLGNGAGGVRV